MRDEDKTKEELIDELKGLRERLAKLARAESGRDEDGNEIKKLMDYYESVVNEAPTLITVLDKNLVVRAWNKFSEDYTSVPREKIVGKNLFEVIPSLKKLGWEDIMKKVLETGERYQVKDYKITRTFGPHKGETWYQDVTLAPLRENGEVKGIIEIIVDVTGRRKAEDDLKALKEFSEKIVECAPIGIHVIDRNFIVRSWNSYFEDYTTIKKEDIIGKNLFEVIPALAKDGWDKEYRNVLETGKPFEKLCHKHVRSIGPKKGEVLYQTIRIVPLKQKNETVGAITILEDITELKRAQESLEKSEEKYRLLVTQNKDAIFIGSLENNVTYASPACEAIFGYTPEEFMSTPEIAVKIIHPDCQKQMVEFWGEYARTKVFPEKPSEWKWIHKDGRIVYTENTFTNIYNEKGEITGFQTVARDITERKRMEEALRKEKEELEYMNRLMIGRELKMIELKKEINDLLHELGRKRKYD